MNNVGNDNKNIQKAGFVEQVYDSNGKKLGCHYSWDVVVNGIVRHGVWTICRSV